MLPLPCAVPSPLGLPFRRLFVEPTLDAVGQPHLVLHDLHNEEAVFGLAGVDALQKLVFTGAIQSMDDKCRKVLQQFIENDGPVEEGS